MHNTSVHIGIYVLAVLLMANLNAMTDAVLHPEIPYFDEEHLIVGGITGLLTALLGGFLLLYIRRTHSAFTKLNRLNAKLRDQTIRDGLTGLYNHRHFQEMLHHEFLLARRHNSDLACLMLDLDRFKEVNDTYGHPFGDHVLAGTATLILNETRITDTVARYGGEDFALLLPNTDHQGALAIAERIRTKAENYLHRQRAIARIVTISIGLATLAASRPEKPEQLLELADQALYAAKRRGRNRVVIAHLDLPPCPAPTT
ncbi:MAG TPA: GGDEF domain-containing protein [Desulfurivibrionaceae bacterium]|nr:GGDEF domain-containing protein [Desulfurivibrionaceae bacterium]